MFAFVYNLLMFRTRSLERNSLTAQAEVAQVSPSSCCYCTGKPQRRPRTRPRLELLNSTHAHLEQRYQGPQTPQQSQSL